MGANKPMTRTGPSIGPVRSETRQTGSTLQIPPALLYCKISRTAFSRCELRLRSFSSHCLPVQILESVFGSGAAPRPVYPVHARGYRRLKWRVLCLTRLRHSIRPEHHTQVSFCPPSCTFRAPVRTWFSVRGLPST